MDDEQYDEEYQYDDYYDEDEQGNYVNEAEEQSYPNITSSSSSSNPYSGTSKVKQSGGCAYQIIEFSDISNRLKRIVEDLSSLLDIDENSAEYMLQYYNWDKEKIVEVYFADCEKTKAACGLDLYAPLTENKFFLKVEDNTRITRSMKFTCKICYEEYANVLQDGFGLGCNHFFCNSCFKYYLSNAVVEGPMCVIAHCPEHKCKQAITKNIFQHFLSPRDLDTYHRYVSKRFIECIKTMRYCPAPNCEKVAVASGKANICCDCSYQYCFACGEEEHLPASCDQVAQWNIKCTSDGESAKWIFANTKKCPKCHTRIEKNQGCNHMTCRQCKHEFCWICMGNWIGHTTCNRFTSEEASKELNAIQRAKAELDRYLHYYNRYQAHDMSLKYAAKDRKVAETRMKERQMKNSEGWIDVQFIPEAVEQVIACRRVLKYTYVVGFYLPDNSLEKQLFDRHQEMLEENTEKLHEYTEQKMAVKVDRTQVVNWTRITEKFKNSILEGFMDGHLLNTGALSGF